MSIVVVTADETFDLGRGTGFHSDQGVLVVSDSVTTVALFAPGQWIAAIKREPVTQAVEPRRVWHDFAEIPPGTMVKDKDGDPWDADDNTYGASSHRFRERNKLWGPFTEVLDD